MPSKNDLSGFKGGDLKILPEPARTVQSVIEHKKVGRPKKNPDLKRNYKVTVSLTQAEGAMIREKAGLASDATYLYSMLEKAGVFK